MEGAFASIGDIVICLDPPLEGESRHTRRFVGLVIDKTHTMYIIRVLETGQIISWPLTETYLWKETE